MILAPLALLLAIVLFVVLAVFAASVLHAIGKGSFREGFRLLFVQCMGLLGAPLGLAAAWLAHTHLLVPHGAQVELWIALLVGALLGGLAGALAAYGSLRGVAWLQRRASDTGSASLPAESPE